MVCRLEVSVEICACPVDSSDLVTLSVVGFIAVLLFVPETKALSLEELDQGSLLAMPFRMSALTVPSSLQRSNAGARRVPDQGIAPQHQEIYFPHEGAGSTSAL